MRTSMAYFAGAGTVVAAVVAGLGGGLMVANIVSPHTPKHATEMSKLEQRMSAAPIPVPNAASDPAPYLAATQAAATKPIVVAPARQTPQGPQTEAASAAPTKAQPAEASAPRDATAAQSAAASPSPAPAVPSAAREQVRDADVKRSAAEKRRADRRQQWAERHHQRQDQELREVEQKVREETEPTQGFAAEPVRVEMPRIRFFDSE